MFQTNINYKGFFLILTSYAAMNLGCRKVKRRRTVIKNKLRLGIPEQLKQKISSHVANSKEFFRYIELPQSFIDQETDNVFNRLIR